MQITDVPIDKITIPKVRVTAVYDEDLLEQFKSSVAAAGQLEPILVLKVGEEYHLIDGLHRLTEAQEAQRTTIPGVVYEGEERDALLFNIVSNRLRGKTKASEMVQVIAELTTTYGMDSDQVREKTGLTRDYIERLWKIAEAAPSVKEALDKEVIGVGVAFEIARLPDHIQQEELVAKTSIWRHTVKELHEFVNQVLAEMEQMQSAAPSTPRAAPSPPSCDGCKATPDPRYLRSVLLCPDCFGLLFRRQREHPPTDGTSPENVVEIHSP